MSYDLRRQGLDPVLFPPTKSNPSAPAADYRVTLKNVRKQSPNIAGCDIDSEVISLHWQGTSAIASLHSQSFFASVADQSPQQIDRGLYLDPLLAMEKFRVDLLDRQAKGCLFPEENARLRRAIVERLPLPPAVAYFFQLGSYDVTGYFDLTPDFRMQVTSPIYPAGAAPSLDQLIGYETANYVFLYDKSSDRIRLSLASAIETLTGNAPLEKRTLRNALKFSKSSGYFRLLFMAEEISTDQRITRAILLSAPDQMKLAQATSRRQVSAEMFCGSLDVPGVTCAIFPKNFGVSPELRLRVNRKDAYIPVGGMLQEILDLENRDSPPPATLKIRRPFQGRLISIKFDRSSADILKLVLLPGDQITY